jgi:hypothetical protein
MPKSPSTASVTDVSAGASTKATWRSYVETEHSPDTILNLLVPELLRLGVSPNILLNQMNPIKQKRQQT